MYCDFSVYYETLDRTKEKVKKVEDPTGSSTFSRIKQLLLWKYDDFIGGN